ncbi:MAG: sel1 repeat family protein [Proteobacteria bacterium]|nr:sel1 repeat family protein [Pseudomonadota bacterium]
MRRLILLAAIALLAGAPTRARAQDFRTGLDAFNAGDFASAYASWSPLAQRGHAKAQAALGFLYYAGKGVARDDAKSLLWFGRAAEAGQPTAQFFLGLQYYYGRGVRRDLARAYSWCDIALTNGYTESLFCRDAVALEMSAEDMRRSTELTSEFLATHEFRN